LHDLGHDHSTGVTRQLLCQRCNHGLGLLRDDPAVLRAAADYVERHRAGQAAPGSRAVAPARRPRRPATWRQFGMCRYGFSALTRLEPGY
jgi:hypothetical protein